MGGFPLYEEIRLLWQRGFFRMDDGGDFDVSFSDLINDPDLTAGEVLTGLSTPDGLGVQSGSEILSEGFVGQSLGSFSLVGDNVALGAVETRHVETSSPSTFDTDKHVRLSLQSQSVRTPKQVWETGVWSTIFSDSGCADSVNLFGQELHRLSGVGPMPAETSVEPSIKKAKSASSYQEVVRFKPDLTWKEQTAAASQSSGICSLNNGGLNVQCTLRHMCSDGSQMQL